MFRETYISHVMTFNSALKNLNLETRGQALIIRWLSFYRLCIFLPKTQHQSFILTQLVKVVNRLSRIFCNQPIASQKNLQPVAILERLPTNQPKLQPDQWHHWKVVDDSLWRSILPHLKGLRIVAEQPSDVSGLDRFEILPLNRSKSQIKALNRFVNRLNQMNQIK